MPLIVSPRQLSQRSQFYQQLAQLTAAGIPIISAMQMLARNPPARSMREPIERVIQQLTQGASFAESMRQIGRWVPEFDIALIHAGEQSGRMDAVFRMLSEFYQERATLVRQVMGALAYPLFVFHFAILLFPFLEWFKGGSALKLALETLGILIPLYAGVWLMIYSAQARRGLKWRTILEKLLRVVPVVGSARRALALARLSAALEALINAGVTIIEAWEMAAATSGSPAMERVVQAWRPQLLAGQQPSEAVNAAPRQFPEVFANLYRAGEVSGQLDDSLRRLYEYYQEEASRKLRLLATWVPKLIYFCVAGMVAWKVISFYVGYFNELKQIGNF